MSKEETPPNDEGFFVIRDLPKKEPKKYHKIESFCFVVTENIKEEAELLLSSLREFHDQPVYIICDKESRKHIVRQGLSDNVVFRNQAEQELLDEINEKIFKNHSCIANNIHNAPCILKKMDVMDFALKRHSNTFFLDADIIVLDNLQEYFVAPIALSPHYYPKEKKSKGFEFGFYNAGYVFCADKGFPRFWKHMYLNDSIFFEQECMNRISGHYNIQTFGKEHNVGFWRGEELPEKAKSVHAHITQGVDKNRSEKIINANSEIKDYALAQAVNRKLKIHNYIRKYHNPSAKKKLAFIHFGKTGGVYVNHYLRTDIIPIAQHFNSWWDMKTGKRSLQRDWTKEELLEIAEKDVDIALAHNHQLGWCKETVQAFKNNGWLTFMFLRDPKNLMCSLYFWAQKQNRKWRPALPLKKPYVDFGRWDSKELTEKDKKIINRLANPLSDEFVSISGQTDPESVTLDDFIKFLVTSEEAEALWVLPDYTDDVEYVVEMNDKNFGDFLSKYFSHNYKPKEKRNVSKNKGYKYYCDNGEISIETQKLIESHPEYKKYSKHINECK
jgi:hypothetical protein